MKFPRPARVFLAGSLLLALASCAPPTDRLIVWIEVDTLRADALGCYGNESVGAQQAPPSPHIDRLAEEGLMFERAYSAAPWTVPSLTTQFTGLWPWEHGALRLVQAPLPHPEWLPEQLQAGGWKTAGVTTNFVTRSDYGFARGFDKWDESFAKGHRGSFGKDAARKLLTMADESRAQEEGDLFLYLLLFEPHFFYEDQPETRFGPGHSPGTKPYRGDLTGEEELSDLRARRSKLSEEDAQFLRGRYQGEVAAVDAAVGELLSGLDQRGLLDDAWIVFTADHGEELMDRGWIGHTIHLHDELVRVPLILRPPSSLILDQGRRIEFPVSQIDLPATVLELAGIQDSIGHSSSLLPSVLGRNPVPFPRRYLYLHTDFDPPLAKEGPSEKRSLAWGVVDAERRLKWIVDRKPGHERRSQLFDLKQDPAESVNLASPEHGGRTEPELQRLAGLDPADPDGGGAVLLEADE